jgi:hypothetical protein
MSDATKGERMQRHVLGHRRRGLRLAALVLSAAALALLAVAGVGSAASAPQATKPSNTSPPSISDGTPQDGQALTAHNGKWTGTNPISYAYQWQRCDSSGGTCQDIGSANNQSYVVTSSDVGRTLRVVVTASNQDGSSSATSDATRAVTSSASAPRNTSTPTISGTNREGQTLTVDVGKWSGTQPISFAYQWLRCDGAAENCQNISGATGQTYVATSGDVGQRLRAFVTASNSGGSSTARSHSTQPIVSAGPAGATKLPTGETSIPVTSVSPPQRLNISGVAFSSSPLRSRSPFQARFRVTDTRGYVVSGALVYLVGLPYGRIQNVPEAVTGQDGWAGFTLTPTAKFPLVRGATLVFFVRARKPGDNVLTGVSNRRLVQVRISP